MKVFIVGATGAIGRPLVTCSQYRIRQWNQELLRTGPNTVTWRYGRPKNHAAGCNGETKRKLKA